MVTKNSVFIGFLWSQGFSIPEALVAPTSALRIDWKKDRAGAVLIRSTESAGIERTGTDFLVLFTAEQTALLTAGRLTGEFVEEQAAGGERVIGARVVVPVVQPFAEPTP